MKWALILFCGLWAIKYSDGEDVCYNSILSYCAVGANDAKLNCSACYGGFLEGNTNNILSEIQKFAISHISSSFDYLLLATEFGSFVKDRKGFEKLYRHLSDSTWEDGIELMKFITKRGGSMDFHKENMMENISAKNTSEIGSLARAMDIHKKLADHSFKIHTKASEKDDHEPEVASFLENNFLHKHADIIRTLAGHISDLRKMIVNPEQKSVSLFLFDEYLQEHSL